MAEIEDQVRIRTTPARIYEALTRTADIRLWWSKKCTIADSTGGDCTLEFDKAGTIVKMKFRIDALDRQRRVAWTCTGNDTPSWIGTTLEWTISPVGDHMILKLVHAGWKDKAPEAVATGWKHFLPSLKSYIETGTGQPW